MTHRRLFLVGIALVVALGGALAAAIDNKGHAYLLLAPPPGGGGGPIAFVNTGTLGNVVGGASLTASYSVATGTDEGLVVCVASANDFITGVAYNSIAATLQVKNLSVVGGHFMAAWYFPLGNTTSGTPHNIVVTASGATNISGVVGEYSKIQQSTTANASTSRSVLGASDTVPITTSVGGAWYIGCVAVDGTPVNGSNTTLRLANGGDFIVDSAMPIVNGANNMNLAATTNDFVNSASIAMAHD
jgi:hypothetical protein